MSTRHFPHVRWNVRDILFHTETVVRDIQYEKVEAKEHKQQELVELHRQL